jgi:hypothetical protein
MQSALDQAVAEASHEFVARLDALNTEPYIREAIMKLAVRETIWALVDVFENRDILAEQLELLADLVRAHRDEDTDGSNG